ncbi:hypothetical protein BCIN_01g03700 [Botrytis cinerea B05.10]|uniref:Uncharacterized protein n=1 Tax=Botryotinia fuckeliana (strain B05.10) TaxID=332648 RepID=A0A384J517_BOTFB|nr:hypothetical protein BCIN_01g03700 [Botrytis cinerea B05.10]XP_024546176.1 hypothetical protein BCIN_01g03700 [Botrytis cinerea B05.10]ATZ45620.1 hypothetical protein BCIN_01g03700 [Botrytis cinerea B05.10]ATZ45621.1 hypothetical protein BCIN_01g03700 [Botrytis cinerea B05.10]
MQFQPSILTPFFALFTNAQSISFPDISIPSTPKTDIANGQLSSSSSSFSSSSSSFANGQGSSNIQQVSTTCNSDANCETRVNGIVNGTAVDATTLGTSTVRIISTSTIPAASGTSQQSEQTAGPIRNGGLLGGNADLATSGTAGSTVIVTKTASANPTGVAKVQDTSSEARRGIGRTGNIMTLALGIAIGALAL